MEKYKRIFGAEGEKLAVEFLQKNSYRILDKNYKCIFGEIDIIAESNNLIHFVEVKTRKSTLIPPETSVNFKKQQHIAKSALNYLKTRRIEDKDCCFDVISIISEDGKKPQINHIKNAFEL